MTTNYPNLTDSDIYDYIYRKIDSHRKTAFDIYMEGVKTETLTAEQKRVLEIITPFVRKSFEQIPTSIDVMDVLLFARRTGDKIARISIHKDGDAVYFFCDNCQTTNKSMILKGDYFFTEITSDPAHFIKHVEFLFSLLSI